MRRTHPKLFAENPGRGPRRGRPLRDQLGGHHGTAHGLTQSTPKHAGGTNGGGSTGSHTRVMNGPTRVIPLPPLGHKSPPRCHGGHQGRSSNHKRERGSSLRGVTTQSQECRPIAVGALDQRFCGGWLNPWPCRCRHRGEAAFKLERRRELGKGGVS